MYEAQYIKYSVVKREDNQQQKSDRHVIFIMGGMHQFTEADGDNSRCQECKVLCDFRLEPHFFNNGVIMQEAEQNAAEVDCNNDTVDAEG